jgi:hypothetical protein
MVCKAVGNIVSGVNTPPKNTMAMRTTVAGGMACGMSLNGAASNNPNAENIKEETRTPIINSGRFGKGTKGIIIIVYVKDKTIPKKNPANALPNIIVNKDIGAVTNELNVPVLLSNGKEIA